MIKRKERKNRKKRISSKKKRKINDYGKNWAFSFFLTNISI